MQLVDPDSMASPYCVDATSCISNSSSTSSTGNNNSKTNRCHARRQHLSLHCIKTVPTSHFSQRLRCDNVRLACSCAYEGHQHRRRICENQIPKGSFRATLQQLHGSFKSACYKVALRCQKSDLFEGAAAPAVQAAALAKLSRAHGGELRVPPAAAQHGTLQPSGSGSRRQQ